MKTGAKYCALCWAEIPPGSDAQTRLDGTVTCLTCTSNPPTNDSKRVVERDNCG